MLIKMAIILFVFLLGLYYFTCYNNIESFNNQIPYRCPDILIQKGKKYVLFNSKLAKIPGVNPVVFNNLEDYVEFTDWQRSQGIRCPILFLQESFNAQGDPVYKARPSPTNLQGGLPEQELGAPPVTKLYDASRNDPPYNKNSYPGFDPQDQYVGLNTPLDKMYHDNQQAKSPNPMDPNWGGQSYTQNLVDEGYYAEDEVTKETSNN